MNTIFIILGILGTTEIIIILVLVLLLFGGRKIPELMRGLGRGVREYKKGMNEDDDDTGKTNQSSEDQKK